jgi:hypothetical protein
MERSAKKGNFQIKKEAGSLKLTHIFFLKFSDFKLTVDPNYGNCYTYNHLGQQMIAKQAGMGKGMHV